MEIDELAEAARTGRELDLTGGAQLDAAVLVELLSRERPPRAVRLRGARITGELDLGAMTIDCPLALEDCVFDGAVRFTETVAKSISMRGSRFGYLRADYLRTSGFLDLARVEVAYLLNIGSAHVGHDLYLGGARLGRTDKTALLALGIEVGGNLHARDLKAEGALVFTDALVSGHFDCSGADVRNPGDRALTADNLQVGTFMGAEGFSAQGVVFLSGARIGAELVFDDAQLSNPDGFALSADRISVAGDLSFRNGFSADGSLRLVQAHVGGRIVFDGQVRAEQHPAFVGDGIYVDGDVEFRREFTTNGEIRLFDGRVGHTLRFAGTSTVPAGGATLELSSLQADVIELLNAEPFQGKVDLIRTRVRDFVDRPESWSPAIGLLGFEYQTLRNDEVSVRQRLSWLRSDGFGYSPAGYDQLAAAYRRLGRVEAARRVQVAKQWRRRRVLNPVGKLWNWLLYVTVGYGYRTWLAGLWLVVLVALGTTLFGGAFRSDMRASAPVGPAFQPVAYALDVLVPIVDLGQKKAWYPQGGAQVWSWVFTGAGWVLTTAVVAGLTNALKRD
ncbi:hypothetical protein M8542_43070 [Amycolatopsis sp. OK19-0408]|uniref:Membrane-associated oxidoreductase n=1 Tax=Amycolatopsis iheyensis TaxID=2945988 RepID=A0A9X2NN25_9PSEU|nr:hypothetical protein [Amycolatopsis iheyensis]MCR6489619.1 hypothetical protein [Amycolatopsis iheyensis]